MKDEQILDSSEILSKNTEENILYPLFWWESMRLWYNIILIGLQTLLFIYYWDSILIFFGLKAGIIEATMFTVVANIFYTCSWGFEFLVYYYLNKHQFPHSIRKAVFLLSCIFSVLLTLVMYNWGI